MSREDIRSQILGILCSDVGIRSRMIVDSLGISPSEASYILQYLKDRHLVHNRGMLWYLGEEVTSEEEVIEGGSAGALLLARSYIVENLRNGGKYNARTGGIDRFYLMRLTGYDAALPQSFCNRGNE